MPSEHPYLEHASAQTRTEREARMEILMNAIEEARTRMKHLYSIQRMGDVASEELAKILEAKASLDKAPQP